MLGPHAAHSPNADDLNTLYWVMLAIGLVLLVAINLAVIGIVMRFRSARGQQPRRLVVRRPAQLGTAGLFAAIVIVTFVLGVIKTHDAKQVEASGPNGLQATSSMLAQRSLTLPVTSQSQAPLQIKACGQQWIWRYEYPDGTYSVLRARGAGRHDRDPQPLLHGRRPPLVGPRPERQVRCDAR